MALPAFPQWPRLHLLPALFNEGRIKQLKCWDTVDSLSVTSNKQMIDGASSV